MRKRLQLFFYRNSHWTATLFYLAISVILIIIATALDFGMDGLAFRLREAVGMKRDLTMTVLTTLVGAFLTIITFTFSTILSVLGSYASNYTPRVVENFIRQKITSQILGIYIGGAFFCIAELFILQQLPEDGKVVAGTVAIVYAVVCMLFFVRFAQTVLSKFQGVELMTDVAADADATIQAEVKAREASSKYEVSSDHPEVTLYAPGAGYLNVIDTDGIEQTLKGLEGKCTITVHIGDFVADDAPIAILQVSEELSEETLDKVESAFLFSERKVQTSDYRYNLTKLVEIALRAISPGINDPNTAIHVIHQLGVLMGRLVTLDEHYIQNNAQEELRIYYTSYSFRDDLFFVLDQLIHYGKEDMSVIRAILQTLHSLVVRSTPKNREAILELADFLSEKVEPNLTTRREKEELRERVEHLHTAHGEDMYKKEEGSNDK